jgi:outer membrane immunogenic protein
VSGGAAVGDIQHRYDAALNGGAANTFVQNDWRWGWTVGAGAEYMFAPNWSAKAEYQYYNFGDAHFTAGPLVGTGNFTTDDHTIKAGVNYRFNWAGPVAARY